MQEKCWCTLLQMRQNYVLRSPWLILPLCSVTWQQAQAVAVWCLYRAQGTCLMMSSRSRQSPNCWAIWFTIYRWTWIWQTQWDQENWSVICKIRRIHMTNTWYASDWDQAYRPSYAKICRTVVRHIQVHLYNPFMPVAVKKHKSVLVIFFMTRAFFQKYIQNISKEEMLIKYTNVTLLQIFWGHLCYFKVIFKSTVGL